ncbi:MAG TPA: ABC-F family ATP-binding cassette domain-containing protein [Polyangiales bacterium]
MSVLSARGLCKAYGPQTLFLGASLTIGDGEHVGLLGENGAGKSTLLRVIAGAEPTDEGVIERKRDASILYLPQEPKLPPELSPRQIVEAGLSQWHAACARHAEVCAELAAHGGGESLLAEQAVLAERIEHLGGWEQGHLALDMLQRFGVDDVDRPIGSMSGGEQRRVALAKILVAQPQLAILDEPTNHLDVATIEYLEEYLTQRFTGAVLLVTHDRYVLEAICDRILELEHGTLTEYRGNYSDYLEQKAERLEHALRHEDNRQNLLRRERAWLLRGAKARTTKQKARIQRAESLMAVEAPKLAARVDLDGLQAGAAQTGKTIVELADVGMQVGGRTLIDKLTFHMVAGERMGVVGPNGAGKTTLLKLISQELTPTQGRVVVGARTKLAYFDQARAGLRDEWSIYDNVAGREGAERDGGGRVEIGELVMDLRTYLERFLFDGSKQRQKVGALSGGERARVALAKALRGGANLLLLDEPTNDLDIATLGELEEMLCAWPGCVVAVSHDRAFLNRVATSILAFEAGGVVVRYSGDYDTYRAQRAADKSEDARKERAAGDKRSASTPSPKPDSSAASLKPLSYAERIELDGLMDRVAQAEERVTQTQSLLADPAIYGKGPEAVKQAQSEYEAARNEAAKLLARWEELEARNVKPR